MSSCASGSRGPAAEEAEPDWFILSKLPVPYRTVDCYFGLERPPAVSRLRICEKLAPAASFLGARPPVIAAVHSNMVLFNLPEGNQFLVYNAKTGKTSLLPPAPEGVHCPLRATINTALAENPARSDHFVVAQISKTGRSSRYNVLTFNTLKGAWESYSLPPVAGHWPWNSDGVFFHDGRFWWADARRGTVLLHDPFPAEVHRSAANMKVLRLGCAEINPVVEARFVRAVRMIRLSGSAVRFVEITGVKFPEESSIIDDITPEKHPMIVMKTFRPAAPGSSSSGNWLIDHVVGLDELWKHPNYVAFGLQQGIVPRLGFLHPTKPHVVYLFVRYSDPTMFLQLDNRKTEFYTALVEFNLCNKAVLSCTNFKVRKDATDDDYQSSNFVEPWVLPPNVCTLSCEGLCGWAQYPVNSFHCGGNCRLTPPQSIYPVTINLGDPRLWPLPAPELP